MKTNSKRQSILCAVLLIALMAVALVPAANADLVNPVDRDAGAYLSVNPHLIGLTQPLLVNLWIYPSPPVQALKE